jgi:hypothetical protein
MYVIGGVCFLNDLRVSGESRRKVSADMAKERVCWLAARAEGAGDDVGALGGEGEQRAVPHVLHDAPAGALDRRGESLVVGVHEVGEACLVAHAARVRREAGKVDESNDERGRHARLRRGDRHRTHGLLLRVPVWCGRPWRPTA